jgi:hypothetical protein
MSNEFKLSHGSRERKRWQSITLTAIEIERLASEGARPFVRQGETAFLECAIEKGGEYTEG